MCSLYSNGEENWILTASELSSEWNVDITHATNGIECTARSTCDGAGEDSCLRARVCVCASSGRSPHLSRCARDSVVLYTCTFMSTKERCFVFRAVQDHDFLEKVHNDAGESRSKGWAEPCAYCAYGSWGQQVSQPSAIHQSNFKWVDQFF